MRLVRIENMKHSQPSGTILKEATVPATADKYQVEKVHPPGAWHEENHAAEEPHC